MYKIDDNMGLNFAYQFRAPNLRKPAIRYPERHRV